MRKFSALLLVLLILHSCSSTKDVKVKPLYEVLNYNNDGGANIKFYEILTEPKEIKMLLSDATLKRKIKPEDLQKSNFVILNMGEMPEGNYKIEIDKIEETPENIVITVKETQLSKQGIINLDNLVYPYSVVKINSKKNIVIK